MQPMSGGKFLGRLLIEKGLITAEQLSKALDIQQREGRPLGRILIDLELIDEKELYALLGAKHGVPYIDDLSARSISEDVIAEVPRSVAHIYSIVPIASDKKSITVAMTDPSDIQALDDLRLRLNKEIKPSIASERDIQNAIGLYYGEEGSFDDIVEEMDVRPPKEVESDIDEMSLKELANQAPVVKLLNLILLQAVKAKASDIHLEPFEDDFKVRYRVDGALYEMKSPPKTLSVALISRIKVMAHLDISERRLPQDGRILMTIAETRVDIRVSTLPTIYGESVVMRVLDKSVVSLSLDKVGLPKEAKEKFRQLIHRPNGIVLVTGPTGSGKTTTLYSALQEINGVDHKIITTEDPVEYDIDGIIQVPINPKIGMTFARCLRSMLRQDPDIVMVGEIRDEETAQIAVQASLTGHLVFSTLHTNDAPGAVTRLIDMGIEPFLITSALQAVLAQRLVRTICKVCKKAYVPRASLLADINIDPADVGDRPFYAGEGCSSCAQTGYKGRTGIFEMLSISDPIKTAILSKAPTAELRRQAQELGMRTLREDGLRRVFEGVTTIEEIVRETQQYS